MSDTVPMDVTISDLQISGISDQELSQAFNRVLLEHKDTVAAISQSMKDADDAYRKYLNELYIPIEEEAKKDRANLNKAEKNIAEKFATLKTAYERPLEKIEINIKQIRKAIQSASGVVDSKVKAYEEAQKSKKREEIEAYFKTKNFELVPLERIFDGKWLNKGTKMRDIREKIDEDIAGIYRDIEVLERIPEYGQTVKAMYIETLDMGAALRQVDILKENAERLAREQANREARKAQEEIQRNASNEQKEERAAVKEEQVQNLVDQAMDIPEGTTAARENAEIVEVTLKFRGTREQLLKLREYMTNNGIPYQKAVIMDNDRDAAVYMRQKNIAGQIKSVVFIPNDAA